MARSKTRLIAVLTLAGVLAAAPAGAQAINGEALFKARCQMCHSHTAAGRNGIGPALWGLGGRAAAASPGFAYSKALTASQITWTPQTLDTFLTAPNKLVPGTMMVVSVPNEAERKAIVAYLVSKK
jgi:cytochrome c